MPRPAHLRSIPTETAPIRGPKPLRRWQRIAIVFSLGALLLIVLAAAATYRWLFSDLPSLPPTAAELSSFNRPPGMAFYDRDGALIAQRGPRHGAAVPLAELPTYVPKAFLAAEDRRFYEHAGVDWPSIARAAWENARARRVVQGGSTLTQQLVKIILLTPDQTLKRKLQEAILATQLERRSDKDAILTLYLNRIYFGEGAYGLQGAATAYFSKPAADLTLSEAALLAALPKAPSRLDPTENLDAAWTRARLVLSLMRAEGWITPQQEQVAAATPPTLAPPQRGEGAFGYVLDLAQSQARELAGPIGAGGAPDLIVRLTVDPRLQSTATRIVGAEMRTAPRRFRASQAALIALAPDGGVRALVGGVDHRRSPYNRAVTARRQPGSAFKPFVYAAALEDGVSPTDVRTDRPVRFGDWSPRNYGGGYAGAMTVATALATSRNTIAAQLADEVGPDKLGRLAARFGFTTIPARPLPSVALGSIEVSLIELTGAMQTFALNGGRPPRVALIDEIRTSRGDVLYRRAPSAPIPVYDRYRNRQMVAMLKGVVEAGTGKRAAFGRPAAGKTGTSQDWRDAWFVGFTPDFTAGVWVGNDDDRPMDRVTGGDLPAALWRRFMVEAHAGLPIRDFDGLAAPTQARTERDAFYTGLAAEFDAAAAPATGE